MLLSDDNPTDESLVPLPLPTPPVREYHVPFLATNETDAKF
jgi:hypothetical protein